MVEKICALIPSFNEARTIGDIIRALRKMDMPVVVIDDGSWDDTTSIAEAAGAVVISHKVNQGKGASLREGFAYILKSDFEAVLVMDGDGQHHPEDVHLFKQRMNQTGADIVIGNRMDNTRRMPIVRVLTNRFMSHLISKISGQYIPDTQCGFRLVKRQVLERVEIESSNYEAESEILIKASREGFRIESIPIRTIYKGERSRIQPLMDTYRFIVMMYSVCSQSKCKI